jgi:serine-type D-Ala-D-Ala carboxypeptidase (penicillin-binding protein 5/6)
MRPGARRPATAIAVGAALVALACPTAMALSASTGPSPTGPSARSDASVSAGQLARPPRAGSEAARTIGGPLMASSGVVVHQPAEGATPLPNVPASAWVIANAGTGQVLAAEDPHGLFGPASTLKVLTAITLIPLLNPGGMVVATKLATSQQPNVVGLITGRAYQVADLFSALLLISANDAAVALTQATGSFARGMALINAEAQHLQAYDVVAKLPNGLPAAGQVTSAYDEALIARQALAMPAFMQYDSTLAARFEVAPHHWETLRNQNYLLTQYRGGIGGKIGWTISSEATYVGLARRNGVTLIATVLHCTSLQEITSAERLLNWGFAMNGKVEPVGALVPPLAATTTAARQAQPVIRAKKAVALSSLQSGQESSTTGYALATSGVVVAGLGLGSLARTRRKTVPARDHDRSGSYPQPGHPQDPRPLPGRSWPKRAVPG